MSQTVITVVAENGSVSSSTMAQHVSMPKPFTSGDVSEWLQEFDICSRANKWTDKVKALKLPTLLEGEALALWLEIPEAEQKTARLSTRSSVIKLQLHQ